jgi:nitrile hydratase
MSTEEFPTDSPATPAGALAAHDHGHAHDHAHPAEGAAHSHLDAMDVRVRALESLLVAKGYVDPAAIDRLIETYETRVGPHHGAAVVARSWVDAGFRAWLERDATAAIASMGFSGRQGEHMAAVFNSPREHHLVVCTLCSCYPWPVLGLPPVWYKSAPYRSRAVREPRAVLADFGLQLPEATAVRVWDSTAEIRYLVVPMRPAGTDGWEESRLARLVTRDSMIGTGLALAPDACEPDPATGERRFARDPGRDERTPRP